MFRVQVKVGHLGTQDEWLEEMDVSGMQMVDIDCGHIIDEFNRVEVQRYGSKARQRRYIGFVKLMGQEHNWHKVNLVTQPNMYDTWKCSRCGITIETSMGPPAIYEFPLCLEVKKHGSK